MAVFEGKMSFDERRAYAKTARPTEAPADYYKKYPCDEHG
jgi:hypothetical protein